MFSFFKKKKEEPYQASGMSSAYASNPSNYNQNYSGGLFTSKYFQPQQQTTMKSLTPTLSKINSQLSTWQPQQKTQPVAQPVVQPQKQFDTSSYLDKISQNAQNRINLQNTATEGLVGNLRKSGEAGINALKSQIPTLEGGFNKFKEGVYAGLENVKNAVATGKSNAEDTYGQALRQGAEGWRSTQGQIDKKFANLNAVDSSAYQNKYINEGTAFANKQQETLKAQAQEFARLDGELVQATIDAEQLISEEEVKLQQNIAQINASIAQGTVEYEQAIADAYNQAQANIYDIQDQLTEFENAIAVEKQKAELENVTANTANAENKNKALTMVNVILGGDSNLISGAWRPGLSKIPLISKIFGGGQEATQWQGLSNLLTLAARGQLKGSGQVSDFETKMLEKAALAGLDPTRQSEEEFLAGLNQLKLDLQSGGAVDATSNNPLSSFSSQLQPGETLYINPQTGDVIALGQGESIPQGYVRQ